jgi:hypothetical protein
MKTHDFDKQLKRFNAWGQKAHNSVHDDEKAHQIEDEMRAKLVELLAHRCLTKRQAETLGTICELTSHLNFDRWCA